MITLQFISTQELAGLDEEEKIKKLLSYVKSNNIVVLDSKLKPEEEAYLIKLTMTEINSRFKGIEIATIFPEKKTLQGLQKLRFNIAKLLLGREHGLTIIGPAALIKEIKKDPGRIQLLMKKTKK